MKRKLILFCLITIFLFTNYTFISAMDTVEDYEINSINEIKSSATASLKDF